MTNIWAKSFFILSVAMMVAALVLFGFSIKASYEVGTWYDNNSKLIAEKGGEYLQKFRQLDVLLGELAKKEMPRDYFAWVNDLDVSPPCELGASKCANEARFVARDAYFQALVELARFVDANLSDCTACKVLLTQEKGHNVKMWNQSRECRWLPAANDPRRAKPKPAATDKTKAGAAE